MYDGTKALRTFTDILLSPGTKTTRTLLRINVATEEQALAEMRGIGVVQANLAGYVAGDLLLDVRVGGEPLFRIELAP